MIGAGKLRELGAFLGYVRPAARFSAPVKPIDAAVRAGWFGSGFGRVSRQTAFTVPPLLRGRNLICSIATLPLVQRDGARALVDNPWLRQFDPDVPNVAHLTQTVEDLLCEGIAWWEITAFAWTGFPARVRRHDPGTVSLTPPAGAPFAPLPSGNDPRGAVIWIDGREVKAANVIRFDSPNPGILSAGATAIRAAARVGATAAAYADEVEAKGYFRTAEGAEDPADDEVESITARWNSARRRRVMGWIPRALEYVVPPSTTAKDLQLVELKQQAALEMAQLTGLDPEELGVSTTSRTYANVNDRRLDKINDTLSFYMRAITDRLSMPDCTPRGHVVEFDLRGYLKPNPTERWSVYKIGFEMVDEDGRRAITIDEIREAEGWEAADAAAVPAPAESIDADESPGVGDEMPAGAAAWRVPAGAQFDGAPRRVTFDAELVGFAADAASRTVSGVIVPFGKPAPQGGLTLVFRRGGVSWGDPSRVKLLRDHDPKQALGYATEIKETASGIVATFKLGRSPAADDALRDAEDKVLDGLSIGVDFDASVDLAPMPRKAGWFAVMRSTLRETSMTAVPAFDDARVTKVAAARSGGTMECQQCGTVHAADVACPTPAPTTGPPAAAPAATFTQEDVQRIAREAVAEFARSQGAGTREVVDPTRPPVVEVREGPSYRFDRKGNLMPAAHEFSADIIAGLRDGDRAAYDRVMTFARAQFDVITTDVNELNPTPNRPEMYVDQRDFRYPVWNAISKGGLTDITPFTFPKFNSAGSLVGNHTEGTEPSSGTFTVTNQTVTPTAKSGKAKISRETWDQGGNPQIGNLIWQQMVKGLNEAYEAAAVAVLDAATPTSLGSFTAGGGTTGQTLAREMRRYLSALHFVRGGFSMTDAFTQIDLYQHLAGAEDDTGRALFPAVGPSNADGTVDNRWQAINVNGVNFLPAWALAATGSVAASSYLFDRDSVHGWASAPQRLTIDSIEVANVYIGLWAYVATAISDINGVREVIYDPVA